MKLPNQPRTFHYLEGLHQISQARVRFLTIATMVESFKCVPAFYQRLTPPPAELPLLTAQTDLRYALIKPPPLLGTEEFPRVARPGRAPSHCLNPPYRRPARYITRFATLTGHDGFSGPSGELDLTPSPSSPAAVTDGNGDDSALQIPKPCGEVGRPGRGGYNLEETLAWSPDVYEQFKVCGLH